MLGLDDALRLALALLPAPVEVEQQVDDGHLDLGGGEEAARAGLASVAEAHVVGRRADELEAVAAATRFFAQLEEAVAYEAVRVAAPAATGRAHGRGGDAEEGAFWQVSAVGEGHGLLDAAVHGDCVAVSELF